MTNFPRGASLTSAFAACSGAVLLFATCFSRVAAQQSQTAAEKAADRLAAAVSNAQEINDSRHLISFAAAPQLDVVAKRDVDYHLIAVRTAVQETLSKDVDLEALSSYVELNFPRVPAGVVQEFEWTPTGGVVGRVEFEDIRTQVRGFLLKLRSVSPLTLNLHVATVPDGAILHIRPLLGKRGRELRTNGTLQNIYRGLYAYVLRRKGYIEVSGELDLVDDPRETMWCTMLIDPGNEASHADDEGGCTRDQTKR